jgi:hypothetical protein
VEDDLSRAREASAAQQKQQQAERDSDLGHTAVQGGRRPPAGRARDLCTGV